ncbi:MAG: hypothetical protein H0T53_09140 [Herpetosiphonaceae bacterium]|nr:hypothetical protein [Herpetosiphonaceae bacterium]
MLASSEQLGASVERGLQFLQADQRPSGEWPTLASPSRDLRDAVAYAKSPYITSFVIHALQALPPDPRIVAMQARAAEFLQAEREDDGAWNYEGRGEWRIPADLDDTCCAMAGLIATGQRPDLALYTLLWGNEQTPGGPYYTWLDINELPDHPLAKEVDALVNANIVFCFGLLEVPLPGAVAYLVDLVERADYGRATIYGLSPHFLIYCLSRAAADGGVVELQAALPQLQRTILGELASPEAEPSAFNLACLSVALLNCGADAATVAPYLGALLAQQQPDGSWPAWAAWLSFSPNYDGAPALTTALALEALGKHARHA